MSERFDSLGIHKYFDLQRLYKRFSIVLGFLMLLLLLVVHTIVTRHLLDVQTDDQARIAHTQQVWTQMAQIQSTLANAEIIERGYVYTNDPTFLSPWNMVNAHIDSSFEQLVNLTTDNPAEQGDIARLRSLIQAKLNILSSAILLLQTRHPMEAKDMVFSERGRLLVIEINTLIAELLKQETTIGGARAARYQTSLKRTIISIYVATSIVALGIIVHGIHILREFKNRDRRANIRLANERWFRSALTSLGHAVIATDKRGLITFINPKAERLMGVLLSQARGQPVDKLFPLFDQGTLESIKNSGKRVVEHDRTSDIEGEAFLKGAGGRLIRIKDAITPIRDSDNNLLGAVLVIRDTSYERQTQEVQRNGSIGALSPEILTATSQQIDTPLTAASNLIYFVKLNEYIPIEASEMLTLAEGHIDRASHISREVLGFHRQSKPFDQIDLSKVVESVLRSFAHRFDAKHLVIEQALDPCPSVSGSIEEIREAIANLVSNAVDAVSFGGKIQVKLSASFDSQFVTLSIQDDGFGILPDNRRHLFEPFFTTKEGAGYGLGLWVTKQIIERHGGRIQVQHGEDDLAAGTVFSVLLPSAPTLHLA